MQVDRNVTVEEETVLRLAGGFLREDELCDTTIGVGGSGGRPATRG